MRGGNGHPLLRWRCDRENGRHCLPLCLVCRVHIVGHLDYHTPHLRLGRARQLAPQVAPQRELDVARCKILVLASKEEEPRARLQQVCCPVLG